MAKIYHRPGVLDGLFSDLRETTSKKLTAKYLESHKFQVY